MSVLTSLMTLPSLFSLTSWDHHVIAWLFFSTEVVATRAYKLSACAECLVQHGERKYKSQSASAALFSRAALFRSLLQILCCCMQERFNKTDPWPQPLSRVLWQEQEGRKYRQERRAAILRESMQPVSFRATAIKPPVLVSAAPLSGKHKQAWCVDYKYNPLIITECMEDFDERGKSRH